MLSQSYLAKNIMDRHELLENTIGALKEERQSFERVSLNSWFLPVMVLIGLLVDLLLVVGKLYIQYLQTI